MATLMQAVERVRNDGQLPVTGSVSVRDLNNRFPPDARGSPKAGAERAARHVVHMRQ